MNDNTRRALFAFSADPVTNGHVDIVKRASKLFDEIVIATVPETKKTTGMFLFPERMFMIRLAFSNMPKVVISPEPITETTVDLCKKYNAKFLIRGIRDYTDLDFEYKLAYMNRQLSDNDIETIFIPGDPQLSMFSSTTVRELIRLKKDSVWIKMVPKEIAEYFQTMRRKI